MGGDVSLLLRLISTAKAPRDASRAAPSAPPTAPPTTAVLSAGHVAAPSVPSLLAPAEPVEVAVTVTVAAAAVPTVVVAVWVGTSNVPMSVETMAVLLLQQFVVSLAARQQNTPFPHCRTFHDTTSDPPPQFVVARNLS